LLLKLEYDKARLDHAASERMLGHIATLLEGIVSNPDQRVGELAMLTPAELSEVMTMSRGGRLAESYQTTLPQLFQQQASLTPEATALVYEGERLTYAELNAKANQLAHYLQRCGVGPETLVGICVERSLEMVIGLLGILKAGGAYVPLDPSYPAERLRLIVAESEISVVLTAQRFSELLPEVKSIRLDADWHEIARESEENLTSNTAPRNLAYVIYTSGSTGKPKGSMITHEGICNRLLWMQETYKLGAEDSVLQKTPFTFDVSVWEFFWPLLAGARLVMARPGAHGDSRYLVETIQREKITMLHFVPSMLAAFVEESGVRECRSLKRVICSGEALPFELKERFRQRLKAELYNLYGPTEASVDVTYWDCASAMERPVVPIGRAIANTQIYVLDENLGPVPVGVRGELYIGGVGLARGYLRRAELTAERFVPDPFGAAGTRLYRTGDLARYLADGNVEYLGRTDHQVKIRGFRIELEEIEATIQRYPDVRHCAVIATGDVAGDRALIAYVVTQNGEPADRTALRAFLQTQLPVYMVPARFVNIEQMPVTSSGKIDRRKLPEPGPQLRETVFEAPRTGVEEKLAAMWTTVLKLEGVGIHDNFFNLGGNSLLAFQIISRVRDEFNVELPLTRVFETPTVAQLSGWISEATARGLNRTAASIKALPRFATRKHKNLK
jgi:amino acid adenylation domain-containing protein